MNVSTRTAGPSHPLLRAGGGFCVLAAVLALSSAGCRPAPLAFPASLNSPRSEERVRAAKQAVAYAYATSEDRQTALEMLVTRLDDEDDAVRFFAILALERMTGTRLGYNYHGKLAERTRAVQAWRRYLARMPEQAGSPSSTPPAPQAQTGSAGGSPGGGGP